MDISELIQKVEEIYKKYIISDNTPDFEADLKIQLLETFSSILAYCNVRKSPQSEELATKINKIKEKLLSWDPFGPWFKENKELVDGTYELITIAKSLKFEDKVTSLNVVSTSDFNNFKNAIQEELQDVKVEIDFIKGSIKKIESLIKSASISSETIPKPITAPEPVPISKPVPEPKPVVVAKPVPGPKPIPVTKPVPVSKPVPVPKPVKISKPIPVSKPIMKTTPDIVPKPVPITEPPISEKLPTAAAPVEMKPKTKVLEDALTTKKKLQKKSSTKLHSLFTSPTSPTLEETPTPSPDIELEVVDPTEISEPVAVKTTKPPPLKPVEIPPPGEETSVLEVESVPEDQEALYHELISLQGRKYGLERSIKDLKVLYEAGSMNEHEYKQKLSSNIEDLKKISAKIERIREKIE